MRSIILMLIIGAGLTTFMGCEKASSQDNSPVERGEYLITVGGCHDCHSPKIEGPGGIPMPDPQRLLSGHPQDMPYPDWTPDDMNKRNIMASTNPMLTTWAGPWGVSFAANLTPDKETGLGEWTEETFIQTLRSGKHQGQPNGRNILPPMPWFNYREMTDSDLKAIWAYLHSLPPIKNQVPLPVPPASPAESEE